jgi:hypothetical protein
VPGPFASGFSLSSGGADIVVDTGGFYLVSVVLNVIDGNSGDFQIQVDGVPETRSQIVVGDGVRTTFTMQAVVAAAAGEIIQIVNAAPGVVELEGGGATSAQVTVVKLGEAP